MKLFLISALAMTAAVAHAANGGSEPAMNVLQVVELLESPPDKATAFNLGPGLKLDFNERIDAVRGFKPTADDSLKLQKVMADELASMYVRICAAYFLAQHDENARAFLLDQMHSGDPRRRLNATEAVRQCALVGQEGGWADAALKQALIDGLLVITPREKEFLRDVQEDGGIGSLRSPMDDICRDIAKRDGKGAVGAIIAALKSGADDGGAAEVLGQLGDDRAVPPLLAALNDPATVNDQEILALGALRCRQVAPILVKMLVSNAFRATFAHVNDEAILITLLRLRSIEAIPEIRKYSSSTRNAWMHRLAERVLVQLSSDDPAGALLNLFMKEQSDEERMYLVSDLSHYSDRRVVEAMDREARSAKTGLGRLRAVNALGAIGTHDALEALAKLLDVPVPSEMWIDQARGERAQVEIPAAILHWLKAATGRDGGANGAKWRALLKEMPDSPTKK